MPGGSHIFAHRLCVGQGQAQYKQVRIRATAAQGWQREMLLDTCILANGVVQSIPENGCCDEDPDYGPHIQAAQCSKRASSKQQ